LPAANAAYDGNAGSLFTGAPNTLGVGDRIEVTFTVRVDPNATTPATTTFNNQATVTGLDPSGDSVTDLSDDGADPANDPANENDVTPVAAPVTNPELGITTGNVTLSPLTLTDDLTDSSQFGTTFAGIVSGSEPTVTAGLISTGSALPTTNGTAYDGTNGLITGLDGTLIPGDSYQVVFTINVNPNALNAPTTGLDNTATAGGTDPAGTAVTDDSDTATDVDGNDTGEVPGDNPGGPGTGTPTPITPPTSAPQLGLSKAAGVPSLNSDGTFDIEYTLLVENTGDVDLISLSLIDDLVTQFGDSFVASPASNNVSGVIVAPGVSVVNDAAGTAIVLPTPNAAYDGSAAVGMFSGAPSTLGVGDRIRIVFTVRLDPQATTPATVVFNNQASASSLDPAGNPVSDLSNNGTDPTNGSGGVGDQTVVSVPTTEPSLIISKELAETPIGLGAGVFRITYNMTIENDGNVDFTNLQVSDDLAAMVNNPIPNGGQVSNAQVSFISGTVVSPSSAYTGTGVNDLFLGTDLFPVGAESTISLAFDFTPDNYFGPFNNVATAAGLDPTGVLEEDGSENAASPTSTGGNGDFSSETPFALSVPSTPVTLGWFSSQQNSDRTVTLKWQTATEIANAGFKLYGEDDEGSRISLSDVIMASIGDSTKPQNYQFQTSVVAPFYWLIDVDVTGKEVEHGPFRFGEETGARTITQPIDWLQIKQESEQKKIQREEQRKQELENFMNNKTLGVETPLLKLSEERFSDAQKGYGYNRKGNWSSRFLSALLSVIVPTANAADLVSFEVETAGLYRVNHAELMSSGLDLRGVEVGRIGLREGTELWPMHIETGGSITFTGDSSLTFAARGLNTLYSGENRYILMIDEGQRLIVADDRSIPTDVSIETSYIAQSVYEPQTSHTFLSPEDDDAWFADSLTAIREAANKTVSLSVNNYQPSLNSGFGGKVVAQPAIKYPELEFSVWGGADLPGNGIAHPDHQVIVSLGGQRLADVRFDGIQAKTEVIRLPDLNNGLQDISISVPKSDRYPFDLIRLDHIKLRYPSALKADDQSLIFSSKWSRFRVSDLDGSSSIVIRVDSENNAFFMTDRGTGDCTADCVYFAGSEIGENDTYFVASDTSRLYKHSERYFGRLCCRVSVFVWQL